MENEEHKKVYFVREMPLVSAKFGWDKKGNFQLKLVVTDGSQKYVTGYWFDNKTFSLFTHFLRANKITIDLTNPEPSVLELLLEEIRSRQTILVTDKIYPVKF